MDYSTFKKEIPELISQKLGAEYKVRLFELRKYNGIVQDNLSIQKKEVSISPCIDLRYYYQKYIQGTAIGDALQTAMKSFSAQSEHSRAIIVITDGENHEDDAVEVARQAAEAGIKVYAIGVGSTEGQPIPVQGGLLKDKDGQIVVTRLDEETLKEVAAAGNGAYVRAGNDEFGLTPIIDDIKKMEDEEFNSIVFEEYDEQFMYFLGIALFFFVLEMLIGERRSRRHLFDKK